MSKFLQSSGPAAGVWYVVPDDLRPTSVASNFTLEPHPLFMVKQGWMIEIVGLDTMGRLKIEDLDLQEPMIFASLD